MSPYRTFADCVTRIFFEMMHVHVKRSFALLSIAYSYEVLLCACKKKTE